VTSTPSTRHSPPTTQIRSEKHLRDSRTHPWKSVRPSTLRPTSNQETKVLNNKRAVNSNNKTLKRIRRISNDDYINKTGI
jgi:hypothetical protein